MGPGSGAGGGGAANTGAIGASPAAAAKTERHAGQRTWAVVPSGTSSPLRQVGQVRSTRNSPYGRQFFLRPSPPAACIAPSAGRIIIRQ